MQDNYEISSFYELRYNKLWSLFFVKSSALTMKYYGIIIYNATMIVDVLLHEVLYIEVDLMLFFPALLFNRFSIDDNMLKSL